MLFESFTNLDWRFVCPVPNPNQEKFIGGHAMSIIGFDDALQSFKVLGVLMVFIICHTIIFVVIWLMTSGVSIDLKKIKNTICLFYQNKIYS